MEEAPENGKESLHSAHNDGMNKLQNNAKTHDITTPGLKITINFYFLSKNSRSHNVRISLRMQFIISKPSVMPHCHNIVFTIVFFRLKHVGNAFVNMTD
jgi:hypothetical protein